MLITNGFDPEEVPPGDGVTSFLDPDRHSLVHTGRMEAARSSPAPLLAALRKLERESPEAANRLEVVFAGRCPHESATSSPRTTSQTSSRWSVGWSGRVRLRFSEPLTASSSSPKGRAGPAWRPARSSSTSVRRPIVVLGEGTEAARIVADAGAGIATSASDPDEIADTLRRVLADTPKVDGRNEVLERYSYPRLVERLAALIEEIV